MQLGWDPIALLYALESNSNTTPQLDQDNAGNKALSLRSAAKHEDNKQWPPGVRITDTNVQEEGVWILADRIVSSDPSVAMEAVDNLLNSIDTRDAGETCITILCHNWQGHCEPALEDFVLCSLDEAYGEQHIPPLIYTYYTQEQLLVLAKNYSYILLSPYHGLVHPGIDAIAFDAMNSTVWLIQVMYKSPRLISPKGLFLLTAVRGSAYEPSPLRPWKLIIATRRQPTPCPFKLSESRENQHYYFQFWNPRIKSYFMHLRDTDRDLNPSNSPYEQWGFPYKAARLGVQLGLNVRTRGWRNIGVRSREHQGYQELSYSHI
ncbi:hypothetical protein K503DRAFT_856682 [Rhizopogon vinicolor AM-OR11-026]|uniref:Uncharacterized protein n=1 Tax=Rhizopogon vinicolor AM-OR11-026 TaxID=1314800 RepID=A0A1B7N0X3_9AGAM|nr:hypothetical protein K503DRAFT_856682 [Rhizopogon vinicolor AM-OR11-026]